MKIPKGAYRISKQFLVKISERVQIKKTREISKNKNKLRWITARNSINSYDKKPGKSYERNHGKNAMKYISKRSCRNLRRDPGKKMTPGERL